MIRLTAQALTERGVGAAGLLATDGTIQTGIYQRSFQDTGVTLLTPEAGDQQAVMDLIYRGSRPAAGTLTPPPPGGPWSACWRGARRP